jgi:hypothetical protein
MNYECWSCGHTKTEHFALGCLVAGCKCSKLQEHPCICEHSISDVRVATLERVVPGCKVHCAAVVANT